VWGGWGRPETHPNRFLGCLIVYALHCR